MINFIFFELAYFLAFFFCCFIYGLYQHLLVVMPTKGLAHYYRDRPVPRSLLQPFLCLAWALQIYFWLFWSACCIWLTLAFMKDVSHPWIYWTVSFLEAGGPIIYMASKEPAEHRIMANYFLLICLAGFLIFAVWPQTSLFLYGWCYRLLT